MKTVRSTLCLSILLLLIVIIGGAGANAVGEAMFQPRQPVVATINLGQLISGLQHRTEIERQVREMVARMNEEIEARGREIEAMNERMRALSEADRTQAMKDEVNLATVNFQYWRDFQQGELEIERALMFEELFRKIQSEAQSFAQDQGIDMIVLDDSALPLGLDPASQMPRDVQLQRQISQRRLLYVDSSLDVTEQLRIRMNNRFRAAQPAPGAAPGQ